MRSGKVSLHSVWKAFDEAEFGPKNILNLRESLPTAADARFRAEAWLRERQVSRVNEVLLITGRGNQLPGWIPALRAAIVALLPAWRGRGWWSEGRAPPAGSFGVKLGPISSLLDPPTRKRDRAFVARPADPRSLGKLESSTLLLLRRLKIPSLKSLGVRYTDKYVD